jgi:hypothetical protein
MRAFACSVTPYVIGRKGGSAAVRIGVDGRARWRAGHHSPVSIQQRRLQPELPRRRLPEPGVRDLRVPRLWSAPRTGTDSRAGTLIHEVSHFNVVAGTDDIVYGQAGAKSLAASDPNGAINNADNHEYFAENTPSLN